MAARGMLRRSMVSGPPRGRSARHGSRPGAPPGRAARPGRRPRRARRAPAAPVRRRRSPGPRARSAPRGFPAAPPPLLCVGDALLGLALGLGRAGPALGLSPRVRLHDGAVALGRLLALLGLELVLELTALLLVGRAALGQLGLALRLLGLGAGDARVEVRVRGRLLEAALAGEVVVADDGSRGFLGFSGNAAREPARGPLLGVWVGHGPGTTRQVRRRSPTRTTRACGGPRA